MPLCDLKTVLMDMQRASREDAPVTESIIYIYGDTWSHPPPSLSPRWLCCRHPETSCLCDPNGNTVFAPYLQFRFLLAQSPVVNHGPEADDPPSHLWPEAHSGLTLCHVPVSLPSLPRSCGHDVTSHCCKKTGEDSTVRYFKRQRL